MGALTARQCTHKARPWNLERTPSTCISCGCGCPVTLETLRGTVVRARSRDGHYLCAQGRFGWDAAHHGSRLLSPKMRVGGALVVGSLIGLVAGCFGRHLDTFLMRAMDIVFAFPSILLALAITAALGPSLGNAMIAIAVVYVPVFARLARGQVLVAREMMSSKRAVPSARRAAS